MQSVEKRPYRIRSEDPEAKSRSHRGSGGPYPATLTRATPLELRYTSNSNPVVVSRADLKPHGRDNGPDPRLSTALAMTEAAYVEAKVRRRDISALPDPIWRRRVCRAARDLGTFGRRLVDHHSVHHLFLRYRRHIGLRGGRGDAEQLLRPLG
jgi:hypothetical protein